MSWRKRIAETWLLFVATGLALAIVAAFSIAIWESPERWLWLGFFVFISISAWAVYETVP